MRTRTVFVTLLAGVVISGCASIEPKPGFDQVSRDVQSRTGKQIYWRQGTPEDERVRERVRAMLRDTLSADEAVQVALLNNPRLQGVYEELGIAQADVVQAGLLRNPVFEGLVLDTRDGEHTNLDFDVAWDFLGVFTMPLRKQIARDNYEAAQLRVTGEVMDLAAEVRAAFYQAQANQQLVEMLRQVVDNTSAQLEAARRLRAAGNITRLALDQRRALQEQSRLLLADAQGGLYASRERLNTLMGLWGTATQWQVQPRMGSVPAQSLSLEDVERRAVERSLDLAMMRLEMTSLAKRVGLTNVTSVIPDLEIGYAWERDDGEWSDGPSLSLPLPIFDLGQAKRARVKAQLEQLRSQYVELAIQVRSQTRAAARRLELARERERHLREVMLPLRERITQGMQLEYNAMQVGVFRLLQTQQQQLATGQQYVQALRAYWESRAQMEQLLNGRMGEGGAAMADMGAASAAAGMGSEGGGH